MIKVWAVVANYGYEGYSEPDSIWGDKDKAEQRAKTMQSFGDIEVLEYTLNKMPEKD